MIEYLNDLFSNFQVQKYGTYYLLNYELDYVQTVQLPGTYGTGTVLYPVPGNVCT
jgi:hypothetical protein